ncbi:hypothetical protein HSBAA_09840 [Vreelandella sulfidaeris]|uniref:Uncharacterized protein n=1 Tax=Vreelandella sulfidaeris TaxID=115553 RepID=A0A455U5X4_9GAMM|nr:hypothetical protein HSBAA_09840 [Halomonas sulfidaeris]
MALTASPANFSASPRWRSLAAQWVDDVVAWCHQHDIDLASRINSKALRFDAALLAQINDVLDSARIAPLGRSLSGLTSSAQAKEGVEEDKATRESPVQEGYSSAFRHSQQPGLPASHALFAMWMY